METNQIMEIARNIAKNFFNAGGRGTMLDDRKWSIAGALAELPHAQYCFAKRIFRQELSALAMRSR